jgi:catechol 2,3-dioxygenase-like lactoylglutathione lyase family enzyme
MITKLSHVSLFVLDQDKAYKFYVDTLGFKVHTDAKMENGFRWLTITPPDQPDLEIALLTPLADGMGYDDETRNAFRVLLDNRAKRRQLRIERSSDESCGRSPNEKERGTKLRRSSVYWAQGYCILPIAGLPMKS